MDNMSIYLKNKVLNGELIGSHVALFNEDKEVNKVGYERQPITFAESTEGQTSNNKDIFFPIAQEKWGTITHIHVYDALTDGNLLFKSPAEFVKDIEISSQYKIPKNYLIIRLR